MADVYQIADQVKRRITPSDAVGELLCVCLLGTIPLISFCIVGGQGKADWNSAVAGFFDPIAKGQLYLYLFSLLGSLAWLFLNQIRIYTRFWLGLYFVWLLGPALVSMFVYGRDPSQTHNMDPIWITLSAVLFASYIALYYFLLVHIPNNVGNLDASIDKTAADAAAKARELIG